MRLQESIGSDSVGLKSAGMLVAEIVVLDVIVSRHLHELVDPAPPAGLARVGSDWL